MLKRLVLAGILLLTASALVFAQGGPPTPTNLAASLLTGSGGELGVQLTWDSPMGLWGFKIYRSVENTLGFKNIGFSASRGFIDNNVLPGLAYHYYVTAVTPEQVESSPSNTANITLPGTSVVGRVLGKVTDEVTGDPIRNVTIQIFHAGVTPTEWVQVLTDDQGNYEAVVHAGNHVLQAIPPFTTSYMSEWYDDAADSASATPVNVTEGGTATADFKLAKKPVGPQGTIAGTVVAEGSMTPLQFVQIMFHRTGGQVGVIAGPLTDAAGKYEAKVEVGSYFVRAVPPPFAGYGAEWFDNAALMAGATPVVVTEGATSTADFALPKIDLPPLPGVKGKIAGTVVNEVTTGPIANVRVFFYRMGLQTRRVATALTDASGNYEAILDTGKHIVRAVPPVWMPGGFPTYMPEYYDNVQDAAQATPIQVQEGKTFVANFALAPIPEPSLVSVRGMVTDEAGTPIANASVAFVRPLQDLMALGVWLGDNVGVEQAFYLDGVGYTRGVMRRVWTDALGKYEAKLPTGFTVIAVAGKWGYMPEYYDNKTSPFDADRLALTGDLTGIDFSLKALPSQGNSISGTVKDETGKGVPSRIVLIPIKPGLPPALFRTGQTDANGSFTIENVFEGKYFVLAAPYSAYAPAFYKEGMFGIRHWQDADTVMAAGQVTGIDIGVVPISSLGLTAMNGRVLSKTGAPIAGAGVFVTSTAGTVLGYGITNSQGQYAIDGVETGSVSVSAEREGYVGAPVAMVIPAGSYSATADLQLTFVDIATSAGRDEGVPVTYGLGQNYPNPFNPTTTIRFDLPVAGSVRLSVFNLLGQEIVSLASGSLPAGSHAVRWDGKDRLGQAVSTGIYLYRLTVTSETGTAAYTNVRKMLLMK
jgi:hypothetical protein